MNKTDTEIIDRVELRIKDNTSQYNMDARRVFALARIAVSRQNATSLPATPPTYAALADALKVVESQLGHAADVGATYVAFTRDETTRIAAALRARPQGAVPIEWRKIVRELMTVANFRPLCQKGVMDNCRCYDCVMSRASELIDGQTALLAAQTAGEGKV